jgi:hypothetical protein
MKKKPGEQRNSETTIMARKLAAQDLLEHG